MKKNLWLRCYGSMRQKCQMISVRVKQWNRKCIMNDKIHNIQARQDNVHHHFLSSQFLLVFLEVKWRLCHCESGKDCVGVCLVTYVCGQAVATTLCLMYLLCLIFSPIWSYSELQDVVPSQTDCQRDSLPVFPLLCYPSRNSPWGLRNGLFINVIYSQYHLIIYR